MADVDPALGQEIFDVAHMRDYPQWRWHLDEVFVKVNGKLCYLRRAVDHEGEVLEAVVTGSLSDIALPGAGGRSGAVVAIA
jgi:DDE domain